MATTKITSPELFDLASLDSALQLPSGTTAERPASPSTGEWRYNTDNNLIEFYDGGAWRDLQDEAIPPIPSEHFNTVLYTGDGSATRAITGVGFEPDIVWIKARSGGYSHNLQDSSRGGGSSTALNPNLTLAAGTYGIYGFVSSFDTDGFTVGAGSSSNVHVNNNGTTYVAWSWKVNGGTTSSNTNGTITSTVQVNTKTGTSIVQWTGTGSSGTIGHGLSSAPEMLILKDTSNNYNWYVFTTATGSNIRIEGLNTDAAATAATSEMTTTSTLIENVPGTASLNTSGANMIIYAFHSVAGFSKIGSYTGNGSAAGPIINTGFEPAFLMIKGSSNPGSWWMWDNKRNTTNPRNNIVRADTDGAEVTNTTYDVNFLSNGFQLIGTNTDVNGSGRTYIYLAFAADPSAAPVLADSFNIATYTGNSSTQNIQGLGFSPSFVWIKSKNVSGANHNIYDSVRGAGKVILSNSTLAEVTTTEMTGFSSDGFNFTGTALDSNNIGNNLVAWAWKANSAPAINTDGSIDSIVSVNANAGFSIVSYTGNNTAGATIGHGLSQTPELLIVKNLDILSNWLVYHKDMSAAPETDYLLLNTTDAVADLDTIWNDTAPTSSVFSVGTSSNTNGLNDFIAYCFHSVSGYSKFGSYTGNGSATGPVVTTGFQPDYLMIKRTDVAGYGWYIWDSVRSTSNPRTLFLAANSANAEGNIANSVDFNANDFQLKNTDPAWNQSGGNYIYMAFKINKTQADLNYLVVAGGASGGRTNAGGGGAGGLRTSYGSSSGGGSTAESGLTLTAGTYTITVGAGGSAPAAQGFGNNGSSSSLAGPGITTITSIGGGYGYGMIYPGINKAGDGGSGGGAGTNNNNQAATKGFGTAAQGFDGGARFATVNTYAGGGGGGASQVGQASTGLENGGAGGNGLAVSITGSSVSYAGGGGGGGNTTAGAGGLGGGTAGGLASGTVSNATANTGGASGGTRNNVAGGSGGSGVVILRMPTASYSGTTTGSPTVTTSGSDTILTYTGSGTYVHS